MVYSIRSDEPIISSKPLKRKRVKGEHARLVEDFLATHYVAISNNSDGEPIAIVRKKA